MENIFENKKLDYEKNESCSWDDSPKNDIDIVDELQYWILYQRYINLDYFLRQQQKKYGMDEQDTIELKDLLFFYNDLKEMNFIGTDMYANALFLKHKVPYLYRSVGKDTKEDRIFGDADIEYSEHTKTIFKECLKQIETGRKGELFSYTKCFGKMLYKYATLQNEDSNIVIEVRKDAIINAISEGGKDFISIQKYIRDCVKKAEEKAEATAGLPYFAIDMSNARDNSVKCLKCWIAEFLKDSNQKELWHWHKDIVDPIGDAEVVCNFTYKSKCNNSEAVKRIKLNREEFCVLLYKYFSKYAEKNNDENWFKQFIKDTLTTLSTYQSGKLKEYYEKIINDDLLKNHDKINNVLQKINWDNEIKYMSRRKGEIEEKKREPSYMEVYKGSNAEEYSKEWKEILFSAIEKKYSMLDYSSWK